MNLKKVQYLKKGEGRDVLIWKGKGKGKERSAGRRCGQSYNEEWKCTRE